MASSVKRLETNTNVNDCRECDVKACYTMRRTLYSISCSLPVMHCTVVVITCHIDTIIANLQTE